MGAGASIEQAHTLSNIDYASLRSKGINFSTAYRELDSRLQQKSSSNVDLNFLAIRQLSQNLRDQESLERTRRRVLKSRSLPDNLKYKDNLDMYIGAFIDENGTETKDELNQADLDIIDDVDFSVAPSAVNSDAKTELMMVKDKPAKKKKPSLNLHLAEEDTHARSFADNILGERESQGLSNKGESFLARVSPRGTLYMGQYKVNEKGIFPDDSAPNSPVKVFGNKKIFLCDTALMNGSFHLRPIAATESVADPLVMNGGKEEFVEVSTLGSGASGVVAEAIHIPTLTIVALKMLPVYNQEKRQHVSRELRVLYKNLSDLRLIDESLTVNDESPFSGDDNRSPREKCPYILSLYNAFVDPRSGMINLVIEYMDGGSLEDLVKQGGCKDELVLADIAFQTLSGLAFLHKNKNIHRDIKPANILCASSGLIKIADFGISKALDNSCGFANSFVGTVCYMSPERINGENYSFSCDIWSLGLTILAVARGKFPISIHDKVDDSDGSPKIIGGPGGYWGMMKAICDDPPPVAGPQFSSNFNNFLRDCLHKDPSERLSAQMLLSTAFVKDNRIIERHACDDITTSNTDHSLCAQKLTGNAIEKSVTSNAESSSIKGESGDTVMDIIYSIRLEHLDRVLDKLAAKLSLPKKSTGRTMSELCLRDDKSVSSPGQQGSRDCDAFPVVKMHQTHTQNRSVHFDDDRNAATVGKQKKKSLCLFIDPVEDSEEVDDDFGHPIASLPKTSSYFASTQDHNASAVASAMVPHPPHIAAEVKHMVPLFDKKGLSKWKYLAFQMHLPLPIVLIAARSKLGGFVDLDEQVDF